MWFHYSTLPIKSVEIDRNGFATQTEFNYDLQGYIITCSISTSDGSTEWSEWQYNENWDEIHSKLNKYDAASRKITTYEAQTGYEGDSKIVYSIGNTDQGDGLIYMEERWERDDKPLKVVSTAPDGSHSTVTCAYDSEGDETLYTRVSSDGTSEKREMIYTQDGWKEICSDSSGKASTKSYTYDSSKGQSIQEYTASNTDGSSTYSKRITADYSEGDYSIARVRRADGAESYIEKTFGADGSSIIKEKKMDGAYTESKTDPDGTVISERKTLSDGTYGETTWTRQADGKPINQITRYSDGSEDSIYYEYDQNGELIKETETRRNGISSVMELQYNEEDWETGVQTVPTITGVISYLTLIILTRAQYGMFSPTPEVMFFRIFILKKQTRACTQKQSIVTAE